MNWYQTEIQEEKIWSLCLLCSVNSAEVCDYQSCLIQVFAAGIRVFNYWWHTHHWTITLQIYWNSMQCQVNVNLCDVAWICSKLKHQARHLPLGRITKLHYRLKFLLLCAISFIWGIIKSSCFQCLQSKRSLEHRTCCICDC